MRTPVASLLSASGLALALSACQTASNAPNALIQTPVVATAATTGATPGSVPAKNDSLDNFVVPQTFSTFSATQQLKTTMYTKRDVVYPVVSNANGTYSRTGPGTTTVTYSGDGTAYGAFEVKPQFYEAEQPENLSDKLKITRDPRDATYSLVIASAGVSQNIRWQDPLHRTLFPQIGITPNPITGRQLIGDGTAANFYADGGVGPARPNIEYYESSSATAVNTLFFERVGVNTRYVTWMGFRSTQFTQPKTDSTFYLNVTDANPNNDLEDNQTLVKEDLVINRSAYVYGINTLAKDVPNTGSATYTGSLFANTINYLSLDTIYGTAKTDINFANNTVGLTLNGTFSVSGASFNAVGSALVQRPDIPNTALNPNAVQPISRIVGSFSQVNIGGVALTPSPNASLPNTFQASTIEGGFFGPGAAEVGGAFRIVGGQPDTRIDVMGAFTGKKN